MTNLEKTISVLLETTNFPLLGTNLMDLPINPLIKIVESELDLILRCGFPSQILQQEIYGHLTTALQNTLPDYKVRVLFEDIIQAHQTQLPGSSLRGVKNVIAIASGKGGVGKSTITVNLATALKRAGATVGILDADIYGPSIPLMMGEASPVKIKNDRYLPVEAHGVQLMSIGYLTQDEPALIWRGPMLAKSLMQMLNITEWNQLDYLLIDLPPGTGDIQLSLVQKIPLAGAIVVTTPQTVATLDAQKAIKMFAKTNVEVNGIVENMSLHTCSACGHEETIFGSGGAFEIGKEFGYKILGKLPLERQIGIDCDKGLPSALNNNTALANEFMKIAMETAVSVAKKPLNYASKFPPIVVE